VDSARGEAGRFRLNTTTMPTIMQRLRAETAEHHARAEGKDLQRAMVTGRITRARYASWLQQMLLVHQALERAIDRARTECLHLGVVDAHQVHSERIAADLRHHGWDGREPAATAATSRLIGRIDAADGPTLLGMHYVLEGSMNGNRYIAMSLRKALGLVPGQGDRYLDPYGEQQRARWAAWKEAVDAQEWSPSAADSAVAGAKVMFDGVADISEGL
jgi:heme oxygenase